MKHTADNPKRRSKHTNGWKRTAFFFLFLFLSSVVWLKKTFVSNLLCVLSKAQFVVLTHKSVSEPQAGFHVLSSKMPVTNWARQSLVFSNTSLPLHKAEFDVLCHKSNTDQSAVWHSQLQVHHWTSALSHACLWTLHFRNAMYYHYLTKHNLVFLSLNTAHLNVLSCKSETARHSLDVLDQE